MDRADELIAKYLDDAASPEERAELDRLLAASPEVAARFARRSRQDWALRRHYREARVLAGALERVRRAIRPRRARRAAAWAAAAAALLAAGGVAWRLLPAQGALPEAVLAEVREGARLERPGEPPAAAAPGMVLHPGDVLRGGVGIAVKGERTRLALSEDGELALDGARRWELRAGTLEADAAPRPADRALVVTTPHAEVRVLGTRFGVAVEPGRTRVDVREGRVRVTRARDRAAVEVAAGRRAVVAPEGAGAPEVVSLPALYKERFLELRRALLDPANGYFSPDGIPYHAAETFLVDAPDYGHLTTSETLSYWLWLEAAYGRISGDWAPFNRAWGLMEKFLIPAPEDQPANAAYDPARPSVPAPERENPEDYPVALDPGAPVGRDDLADELRRAHGTADLYGMHWLVDADNWYGFGRRGDPARRAGFLNTFQRGPRESVWEAIPHPSWEDFSSGGPNGYLDLFLREPSYARQWRYVCAPDADARAIQAAFEAARAARAQGKDPARVLPVAKAVRMGDSLRYALREKHFRSEPHGLLGWTYAWGGSIEGGAGAWAWRLGASAAHVGYQNPLAAWALATDPAFRSPAPGAARDWSRGLERQVELFRWLQSADGALAGGVRLAPGADPAGFYGLAYDPHPVFLDPPSNEWFGWQVWAVDRLASYAALSGDGRAAKVVDRWAAWVRRVVRLGSGGGYEIPATLRWSGRPDPWDPRRPGANADLRVAVTSGTTDVGVAGALARALLIHGAAESRALGRELLERIWTRYRDGRGVAAPEARPDYARFDERVPVPAGWRGRTPRGEEIRPGITFLDLRSAYRRDPEFARFERARASGEAPVFRYHRFWAQVEVALALAEAARQGQ
jgi:ferric-dicitrate binding protein FerR (iron transport regulator)